MKNTPMDNNEENKPGLTRNREACPPAAAPKAARARENEEATIQPNVEELSSVVVDTAFHLHRNLGPGLLESVYEAILAKQLQDRGLSVARQLPVPIEFEGLFLNEGFRADLVIEGRLVLELKSVEHLAPVHQKQLLTYLRLMRLPLGLLINFGAGTFKEGIKRVVNNHHDFASSRLRVNQDRGEGNRSLPKTGQDEKRVVG